MKIRILTETGLLTRTAIVLQVRSDERIPDGVELGALFREAHVSEDELISDAERAVRYGERPPEQRKP